MLHSISILYGNVYLTMNVQKICFLHSLNVVTIIMICVTNRFHHHSAAHKGLKCDTTICGSQQEKSHLEQGVTIMLTGLAGESHQLTRGSSR